MQAESTYTLEKTSTHKLKDYVAFTKLRLSLLVVFSAAISFLAASGGDINWTKLILLIIGGFLVTGASNGFNQVMERDVDKLMDRTQNRPLPQERMNVTEALLLAGILGILGIIILWVFINPMSGILGSLALLLYTLAYTPLKRKTPFAVFVGAIPGAIPPMLGWVAVSEGFGEISIQALILFAIQFMWQFPHFWAIAWVLDEDYKKGGFNMLPSPGGRDKSSAFQVLFYTLFLLPISIFPVIFKMSGSLSMIIIIICGILFAIQAYKLYKDLSIKSARQLMFGSFIYLPVIQLAILIG